jgi:arabinofuranosyltransferase
MFGLNDRRVVRNGVTFNVDLPGHQRIATWDYLMQRRVNLIVGHPQIVGNDFDSSTMTDTPDALVI